MTIAVESRPPTPITATGLDSQGQCSVIRTVSFQGRRDRSVACPRFYTFTTDASGRCTLRAFAGSVSVSLLRADGRVQGSTTLTVEPDGEPLEFLVAEGDFAEQPR